MMQIELHIPISQMIADTEDARLDKSISTQYPGLYMGRVSLQHKDSYIVMCEGSDVTAEVSGKFMFEAVGLSNYPAVGDFVMLDRPTSTPFTPVNKIEIFAEI